MRITTVENKDHAQLTSGALRAYWMNSKFIWYDYAMQIRRYASEANQRAEVPCLNLEIFLALIEVGATAR